MEGGGGYPNVHITKGSFLRALREVAPEMELFLENDGHYIKNCDKINLVHTGCLTMK